MHSEESQFERCFLSSFSWIFHPFPCAADHFSAGPGTGAVRLCGNPRYKNVPRRLPVLHTHKRRYRDIFLLCPQISYDFTCVQYRN